MIEAINTLLRRRNRNVGYGGVRMNSLFEDTFQVAYDDWPDNAQAYSSCYTTARLPTQRALSIDIEDIPSRSAHCYKRDAESVTLRIDANNFLQQLCSSISLTQNAWGVKTHVVI